MENETGKYAQMKQRLHLQRLGLYIREGADCLTACNDSYEYREQQAERMLDRYLTDRFGQAEKEQIEDRLLDYISVKEDIAFSLGMKSGATLLQALLGSFESDT